MARKRRDLVAWIVTDEDVMPNAIAPNQEQRAAIEDYAARYHALFGIAPRGIHWLPGRDELVVLPDQEWRPERQ